MKLPTPSYPIITIVATLLLTACGSTPSRPVTYHNLGWAKVPVPQAHAECRAEANRIPSRADYNPLANAFLSLGHVEDCMRAKGWERDK